MSEFKAGDRVVYTGELISVWSGWAGTVIRVNTQRGNCPVEVKWGNDSSNDWIYPENLTLIKKPMSKFKVGDHVRWRDDPGEYNSGIIIRRSQQIDNTWLYAVRYDCFDQPVVAEHCLQRVNSCADKIEQGKRDGAEAKIAELEQKIAERDAQVAKITEELASLAAHLRQCETIMEISGDVLITRR